MGLAALALLAPICAAFGFEQSSQPENTESAGADVEFAQALANGDAEGALEWLQAVVAQRRERFADQPLALAQALDDLGGQMFDSPAATPEVWAAVEDLFLEALELRERLGPDSLEVSDSLGNLSTLCFEWGRYAEAERYERRNLSLLASVLGPEHPRVAARKVDLSLILLDQGRYGLATTAVEEALEVLDATEGTDAYSRVVAISIEAELKRIQNRFEEAELAARRALDIARTALEDDLVTVAQIQGNLAGILKDQGRLAEAERQMRAAMNVWEQDSEGFAIELSTAYLNTAEVLRLQNRREEARPHYEKALHLARELYPEDSPELAVFINQTATVLSELGHTSGADPLFAEVVALLENTPESTGALTAQSLHDYAALKRTMGELSSAEELYRRALAHRRELFGEKHPETAATLVELARTLARRDRATDALAALDRALEVLATTPAFPRVEIEAHALAAEVLRASGSAQTAEGHLREALDLVEALRPETGGSETTRAEFMARQAEIFYLLAEWLAESGRAPEALGVLERARARVLLDRLATARVDLRGRIDPETLDPLLQSERELKTSIAELQFEQSALLASMELTPEERQAGLRRVQDELDAALRGLLDITQTIRDASPAWRQLISQGSRPAAAVGLQTTVVAEGSMMLVYQIGERRSFVYEIPPAPGKITSHRLSVDDSLAAELGIASGDLSASALREIVVARRDGAISLLSRQRQRNDNPDHRRSELEFSIDRHLHALWSVLVPGALRSQVLEAERVVLVPDGPLLSLPFEALVVKPSEGETSPEYWLDRGPLVRYAPSVSVLFQLERRARQRDGTDSLLIVADPAFDVESSPPVLAATLERNGQALPRLPGTAAEAAAIRKAMEGSGFDVRVISDTRARETRVREALSERHSHLHFATHGLIDESGYGALAALALTPPEALTASDDDGLLQLFEIYELNLDAELAVLSACQGNLGKRIRGEGVFALSTGFIASGVPRVIASQWAVDDASTAHLMSAFYHHFATQIDGGEIDYERALRDAQREVRLQGRWNSPYYWAPFVLIGAR